MAKTSMATKFKRGVKKIENMIEAKVMPIKKAVRTGARRVAKKASRTRTRVTKKAPRATRSLSAKTRRTAKPTRKAA